MTAYGTPSQVPYPAVAVLLNLLDYYYGDSYQGDDEGAPKNWNLAPRPRFRYRYSLLSGVPHDPEKNNSATILFNGIPEDIALDGKKQLPPNVLQQPRSLQQAVAFLQQAASVCRQGSDEQFLQLWLPANAKDYWANEVANHTETYHQFRQHLGSGRIHLQFLMDFGPEVIAYVREVNAKGLPSGDWVILTLWKGYGEAPYRLTRGADTTVGPVLSDNILNLLQLDGFEALIARIVQAHKSNSRFNRR